MGIWTRTLGAVCDSCEKRELGAPDLASPSADLPALCCPATHSTLRQKEPPGFGAELPAVGLFRGSRGEGLNLVGEGGWVLEIERWGDPCPILGNGWWQTPPCFWQSGGVVRAIKTERSLTVRWFSPRHGREAPLAAWRAWVTNFYIEGRSSSSVCDKRYQFFTSSHCVRAGFGLKSSAPKFHFILKLSHLAKYADGVVLIDDWCFYVPWEKYLSTKQIPFIRSFN